MGTTLGYGILTGTAQAAESASRLHLVWIIDAHAKTIGKGMLKNASIMDDVFSEIWSDRTDRFRLNVIGKDRPVDSAKTLDFIRRMQIGSNDSICVYYCGHGGWDDKRGLNGNYADEKGHFLAMSGGNLYRSALRDAVTNRKLRGAVIVSDCCSNVAGIDPPKRRVPARWEGFEDLFFRHRGLTDIQAATRGQFGWSSSSQGGIFTRCFTKLLCEPRSAIRPDGKDGRLTWQQFFPRLRKDTIALFNDTQKRAIRRTDGKPDIKDYEAQKPEAFFLSEWPEQERYLRIKNNTGEQMCIWLQYYCYSDKAGWHWRGGQKGLYYELKPGANTRLNEVYPGGQWTVRAKKIRYRASTPSMQKKRLEWNQWWKTDRWIVPVGGYRKTGSDMETWTMTFS